MSNFETDVATYLTIDGQVFIAPQFDIKWEMNEGGTCPDFLALDFSCKDAVIVEVTAAANWHPLERRVSDRKQRWFAPAERRLLERRIITPEWRIRFLGFIRSDHHQYISDAFAGHADVTFYPLEDAIIPWKYWKKRMAEGLPGNRREPKP